MTPPSPTSQGISLKIIEGGLTLIAVALAFCLPRVGSSFFSAAEAQFKRLARRQTLSVIVVGTSALLLRLAILPLVPAPLPFLPDDFSFLLAAKTFLAGRLANPTPAMWVHFESIHLTMKPTYVSMYFPAEGLVLAAGKLLFGHPWSGMLISAALMAGGICWMLQAWLPATWALLGGFIAILRIGLFSYWVNTYTGAGCIAALGGALLLGSYPRLRRSPGHRPALLMAVGIILLATSRPYEGLLLCLPVAFGLGRWIYLKNDRPPLTVLARISAVPLILVLAAFAWMGYYNYRAFGSALTLPYKVDRAAYAMAPYYVWQAPKPEPVYRHAVLKDFYYNNELTDFEMIHSARGFLAQTLIKPVSGLLFFAGLLLFPPIIMIRRVFLDRRMRFVLVCLAVLTAGLAIENFLIMHYLAPFTVGFYALGLQAMRHLRVWKFEGKAVGLATVRLVVLGCIGMAGLRCLAAPLGIHIQEWPPSQWSANWYGPERYGVARAGIAAKLESMPGEHLVIVRYGVGHNLLDEWVYNEPDIDASKVIWARGMSYNEDLELIRYYKDRQIWAVEPDQPSLRLVPYTLAGPDMTPVALSQKALP